jgi:hypothetical protein
LHIADVIEHQTSVAMQLRQLLWQAQITFGRKSSAA